MELIKKNIHMERIRLDASTQIAVNEDVNLTDSKPDIAGIKLSGQELRIEEISPGTDAVDIKGQLAYQILYYTEEGSGFLDSFSGSIPIEEKVHMPGVTNFDKVNVSGKVSNFTIGILNSRKINVSGIIDLNAEVAELYDIEIPMEIVGEESVEYRKYMEQPTELVTRRQEEIHLQGEEDIPNGYPNIDEILWSEVNLSDVDFKPKDGAITMRGQLILTGLYLAEGDRRNVQSFELSESFTKELDCTACTAQSIPDVRYSIGSRKITVRPDGDGEERRIAWDVQIDLDIHVYREEPMEVVADVYGVKGNVLAQTEETVLQQLQCRANGKTKLSETIRIPKNGPQILQILYSYAEILPGKMERSDSSITFCGNLSLNVIYISGDDTMPYVSLQALLPYEYEMEIHKNMDKISSDDIIMKEVDAYLEQLQVTLLNGEELDVKAVLSFAVTAFCPVKMELIREIEIADPKQTVGEDLPGMAIYMVKDGDNLWNIGKKYLIPVDKIRTLNELTSDSLTEGQKLLIVR